MQTSSPLLRSQTTSAEQNSAAPGRDWSHPSSPHDGLSNMPANAPQSTLDPKRFGAPSDLDDVRSTRSSTQTQSEQAEQESANPGKEWKQPQSQHAGLTDSQATAPQSLLAKAASGQDTSLDEQQAIKSSANPGKEWSHPSNPGDGLSNANPNSPASLLDT
ncbi:hypothetical protein EMMF5_004180 [Cystobasidiomycetes sp. EMM_F5]